MTARGRGWRRFFYFRTRTNSGMTGRVVRMTIACAIPTSLSMQGTYPEFACREIIDQVVIKRGRGNRK
jgi:hypothetical protein